MKKIHELLKTPDSWTQGTYARDASGEPVSVYSDDACSWCLVGALNYCYSGAEAGKVQGMLYDALYKSGCTDLLMVYNDKPHRTHEEIINLVRTLDV